MIRPLIILINLLVALFVRLLTGTPSAEIKAPSSVKAGEAFTIEVVIQTNGETDFVRYAMDLPEGWSAEKIETAGASFRFEKQAVKFLWSRVGEVKELKISYKVTTPLSASGSISLPSKISHTVDNLPSNILLPDLKINVDGNGQQVNTNQTNNPQDTTAKPPVQISVERAVPVEEVKGSFIVNILVHKEDLTGFGKIEDSIPSGLTASVIKTDGADFKFENGKAKFSWWNLPSRSTLSISYKVTISPDMSGAKSINGYFSYVENGVGKVYPISASIVHLKEPEVVVVNDQQNNSGNDQQNNNTGNTNVQHTNDQQVNNTNDQQSNNGNGQDNSNIKSGNGQQNNNGQQANSGNTGVKYSVQIAAMNRDVPVSYYRSTYNISETVILEQHNGLHKYTVGSFTAYADARAHRVELRGKGVEGPFVTAYNGATRITVQEALMMSNQKWIP